MKIGRTTDDKATGRRREMSLTSDTWASAKLYFRLDGQEIEENWSGSNEHCAPNIRRYPIQLRGKTLDKDVRTSISFLSVYNYYRESRYH